MRSHSVAVQDRSGPQREKQHEFKVPIRLFLSSSSSSRPTTSPPVLTSTASRQVLSSSARPRTAPQWLSRAGASSRLSGQRFFADTKPPNPATSSPDTAVTPETLPKQSPAPGTTLETKINAARDPPVPQTPAPKRKGGRFRRFLIYLILTSGLAYGGGIFLALKSDNFHDFFTEYIPYGEECVLYFEERDFYRRFPNTLRNKNRLSAGPRDEGSRVTIPSKSGLHSKEVEESSRGSDVSQNGRHMSAITPSKTDEATVKPATAKPEEKTAAVKQAKKQAAQEPEKEKQEPKLPATNPITTLEFAKVGEGDEPIVQEIVKTFNDIITVISADENATKYDKPVAKAKEELQKIGEQIISVRDEARRAAQEEIEKVHATFDESARELIRRFDEVRSNDAAQYREEFEAEREKLALAYQQKIQTELQRAQEIAEQRLQNELVEQAIELNRKYIHEVKDLVEREREGRLSKLSELTASVSELEELTTGWREVIDTNLKTQQLQVAVDAVRSALERSTIPRPFVRELVAVKELAGDDDVVEAAIASINPTAYQRGIPSTSQIIERFRRVADEVRKASLLPEDAGIASHAASLVLSKVMFKKDAAAGSDDVESVLLRTETFLEQGNLDAAAREMTCLKGWAKILSKDWLADVRRVLEVKQALELFGSNAPIAELQMSREKAARESLGGSSWDEERGSRGQRRTASSGGFLVESFLPRSKSFRSSLPQSRLSEPGHRGKREAPETEPTPKKRSRFHWSRPREPGTESDPISYEAIHDKETSGSSGRPRDTSISESQGEGVPHHTGSRGESREHFAAPGLDRDSLHIVNLALNLSASRRKGQISQNAPNQLSGGPWASSTDGRASTAGRNPSYGSYSGHKPTQPLGDDRTKFLGPAGMSMTTSEVLNTLAQSATSESVSPGFSGGTLARAANARRHFELRHEYLRLLPSLPPLKVPTAHSNPDSSLNTNNRYLTHRVYNPLQAIRNRKVRFRERCPIDIEADGWNDIEKVHHWVNSVQAGYSRQARSPLECLSLPPFQQSSHDVRHNQDSIDAEPLAVSPPSSVRRVSRTGSLKTRRPRCDWIIYPEELLADAAWAEDTQNKSRIVDKEGNTLYPTSTSFVVNSSQQEQVQGRSSASTGRPSSHTSASNARQSLSVEANDFARGRRRPEFRAPRRIGRSKSASDQELGSKRRKFKIRSPSTSSSSPDEKSYRNSLVSNAKSPRSGSPLRWKGPIWSENRNSMSSVPSADDHYDPLSLAKREGRGPDTAIEIGYFPSIASNLSAPSSRSSSPAKRGFSRAVGPKRAHSRGSNHRKGVDDDSSVDLEAERMDSLPLKESYPEIESTPFSIKASTYHPESQTRVSIHERKDLVQHESKLRGIFKGPGKIAGKVGNEVSKMGDFILGKDGISHSRKSSIAISDESELEYDEGRSEKRAIPKAIFRRLPTFSEEPGRSSPRNSDKSLAKNATHAAPTVVEPRQHRDDAETGASVPAGSHGRVMELQSESSTQLAKQSGHPISRSPQPLQFGPEIHTIRDEIKKGRIKDSSVPFSMARPPITGLAQAQPTPGPSPHHTRPTLSGQTRSWSLSDRSISISIESGVPGKQEVERTRALLLSSGIKAREITRRAESARNPPPEFLQRSFELDALVPSVPRLLEHEIASRRLLKRIEASHNAFQSSIDRIPKAAFLPLKSQLSMLEDLIENSLTPRVHAAAEEAENLSMQLNTTSTLAVKQLSETLDHGVRKRHRRLRWLRRTGFVMLEWALIGLLWWVWLIVVAFRLLRKLLHGMASGVRWILWL
ncbi:MICOS complex subunit MIC60 [Aspergillus lucknowensis]|uniref:MICOS complex subunit MIC60 n=1 Tax=Aspergillus lucknowensis TaxID=176173 RepID=A0ABR4LI45_9EURO